MGDRHEPVADPEEALEVSTDASVVSADERRQLHELSVSLGRRAADSESRAEEFLIQLEQWIIDGYSYSWRRQKAFEEFGVDRDTVNKIEDLIKRGWKLEMMDPEYVLGRKNMLRMKFVSLYQRALEQDDLKLALRTLESMAKLEGLWSVNETNVTVNVQNDVTSKNRERVQELLAKMRDFAMGRGLNVAKPVQEHQDPAFGLKRRVLEIAEESPKSESPKYEVDKNGEIRGRR